MPPTSSPSPQPTAPSSPADPMPTIPDDPMVTFNGCDTCTWSQEEMVTIQQSATLTGTGLAETINASHPGWNLSATQAFLLVYGGTVNFRKTGESCFQATEYQGCWGKTFFENGSHEIQVYTDANLAAGDARWAVHEFGHAFVNTGRGNPISTLLIYQSFGYPNFPNRPVTPNDETGTWGFAGPRWEWQRSDQGKAAEEFADMYLGWVYNQWEGSEVGQARADFMNSLMPIWLP